MLFSVLPWLRSMLFAPNEGEGGGGGAGGSGDDGGDGASGRQHGPGGEGATGTSVTEARVNEIVTKAVARQIKASEEKQSKALEAAASKITETVASTLSTHIADLTEKLTKGAPAGDKPNSHDFKQDPDYIRLQKKAEKAEAELARISQEKAEADARAKATTLRERAREVLAKHGVAEKHLGRLVSAMIADSQVKYDEDGKVVFDAGEGPEDIDRGVKNWVATDEGKSYLPPRNASGSGDGARGQGGQARPAVTNGAGAQTQASKAEISKALGNLILRGDS